MPLLKICVPHGISGGRILQDKKARPRSDWEEDVLLDKGHMAHSVFALHIWSTGIASLEDSQLATLSCHAWRVALVSDKGKYSPSKRRDSSRCTWERRREEYDIVDPTPAIDLTIVWSVQSFKAQMKEDLVAGKCKFSSEHRCPEPIKFVEAGIRVVSCIAPEKALDNELGGGCLGLMNT